MSRTVRPEVATFVAQVRACLSDLSPDEVEELTGGLDADLEERLEDTVPGTPPPDLGDPAAYAAELRAAAGLPPRGAGGGRRAAGPGLLTRTADGVRARVEPLAAAVRRQPWWPEFRASVVSLRPAWWLVRGWLAWRVLGGRGGLPGSLSGLLALLLLVGGSVALGRGLLDRPLRLDRPWTRRILFGLNGFAVLVLLVVGPSVVGVSGVVTRVETVPAAVDGLALDGEQVRNVFAYDAQGRPVPLVQLYDQDGRPLAVAHVPYTDPFGQQAYTDANGQPVAPFVDDRSRNRWNVFPLPAASVPEPVYGTDGSPTATASPVVTQPRPPLVAVPPVTGILGVPSSSPTGALPSGATPTGTAPTAAATTTPRPASPTAAPSRPTTPPTTRAS